jgi:hypothetical protein
MTNGTVTTSCEAAFPETTVTLTVTSEAGYWLGTLTYNDGSDHVIAGPPYTFTICLRLM